MCSHRWMPATHRLPALPASPLRSPNGSFLTAPVAANAPPPTHLCSVCAACVAGAALPRHLPSTPDRALLCLATGRPETLQAPRLPAASPSGRLVVACRRAFISLLPHAQKPGGSPGTAAYPRGDRPCPPHLPRAPVVVSAEPIASPSPHWRRITIPSAKPIHKKEKRGAIGDY